MKFSGLRLSMQPTARFASSPPLPSMSTNNTTGRPDSQKVAHDAAPPPGEDNWWSGEAVQPIAERPAQGPCRSHQRQKFKVFGLQITVPAGLPTARRLDSLVVSCPTRARPEETSISCPSQRRDPKDATPNRKGSPSWFVWLDEHQLGISEFKSGSSHLFVYDISTQQDSPGAHLTLPDSVGAGGPRCASLPRTPTTSLSSAARFRGHPRSGRAL